MAMEVEMNMMGVPTRANCTNEIGYPYLFFHQISYVFLGKERREGEIEREREREKKEEKREERREKREKRGDTVLQVQHKPSSQ